MPFELTQAERDALASLLADQKLATASTNKAALLDAIGHKLLGWPQKRFSHVYSIAFTLVNDDPTGEKPDPGELSAAMQQRVREIASAPDAEIIEACELEDTVAIDA